MQRLFVDMAAVSRLSWGLSLRRHRTCQTGFRHAWLDQSRDRPTGQARTFNRRIAKYSYSSVCRPTTTRRQLNCQLKNNVIAPRAETVKIYTPPQQPFWTDCLRNGWAYMVRLSSVVRPSSVTDKLWLSVMH